MDRSNADSFLYFLEWRQRDRELSSGPAAAWRGSAFSLLIALSETPQGVMALPDLQRAPGMAFLDFSSAVRSLVEAGHLTVSGRPGGETAQLTKLGADVAALARPA